MGTPQSKTEKFKQALEEKLVSIYPPPEAQVIKTESKSPAPRNFQTTTFHPQSIEWMNNQDRQEQTQTTWSNSSHGLLTINFVESPPSWGTGVMIGPNIVLTAGHNLFNFQNKAFADVESMRFSPGMDHDEAPFGSVEVGEYFVSSDYIKEGKEDYGILILKEPIGEQTGYLGLTCSEPEEIKEKRTSVPGIKVTPSYICQEEGLINEMIHGVWEQEGYSVDMQGTTILLSKTMYQQIYGWLQQTSFKKAFLKLKKTKELELFDQEINAECMSILLDYNLDGLTVLKLCGGQIGDKAVKILAKNTSWINLSRLALYWNLIGPEGAKELAQNPYWISLKELNLSNNKIGEEGAKRLAKNTSWINLKELNLSCNNIGAEGVKALAQNTTWINLSNLDLQLNNIGSEGVNTLVQSHFWTNLSSLNLGRNKIGVEGVKALTKSASSNRLRHLNLSGNQIGKEGSKALSQNTSWVSLSHLDLSANSIGREGAKALAQNISWVNLSELNLGRNNIVAAGVKELARNISWSNLSVLDLSQNGIGTEGAESLAENTSWTKLWSLCLNDNSIGTKGAKALAKNTSWSHLAILHFYCSGVGSEGISVLKQNKTWRKDIDILTSIN